MGDKEDSMDGYRAFEGLPWAMSLVVPSLEDIAQSSG
jgi:hypothetical protein